MSARSANEPEIVPATAELAAAFWGSQRPQTLRGIVAIKDGLPICFAGIYHDGEKWCGFSDVRPEMRKHPKAGMRMGQQFVDMVRALGMDVYAKADPACEAAARFLERLGFRRVNGDIFIWHN